MTPKPGHSFVIPAGTPVHSMGTGRWHESKRKQTVWPHHVSNIDGWIVVTWPGSGGYWRRVVIKDGEFVACWPGGDALSWAVLDKHEVSG